MDKDDEKLLLLLEIMNQMREDKNISGPILTIHSDNDFSFNAIKLINCLTIDQLDLLETVIKARRFYLNK